jgi:hypothetical protein
MAAPAIISFAQVKTDMRQQFGTKENTLIDRVAAVNRINLSNRFYERGPALLTAPLEHANATAIAQFPGCLLFAVRNSRRLLYKS